MVSAFEGLPVYDIIATDHDGNAHANTIDHTMTTSTAAMTVSLMLAMFAMLVLSPSISANYAKASNPSSGGESSISGSSSRGSSQKVVTNMQ